MAQKIPFFELFTDFSPDFDLRVPLNAAMVTNMVLEPEKRTMTLDMTVRAEMNDSTRETVEQLLARNYDLKRVDIHVKSTAEAFPDMLKNAGRKVSGSGSVINAELCVGINSFCTNPEAAWSFVRTLLLPENQQALAQNGFPLRRDTLEQMALLAQQPAELPVLPVYFQQLRDDPENEAWDYFSRGLTPEESSQIVSLIEATDVLYRYDAAVAAILAEEAAQYYSGVRTAEEAAALIQNRVQTYLAEQG